MGKAYPGLRGRIGVVLADHILVPLTNMQFARVSIADCHVLTRKWSAHRHTSGQFYALTNVNKRTVYMHRTLVPSVTPGAEVDHRDGDTLNNQRSNLRAVPRGLNQANTRRSRANTSGFKGVHRHSTGKFVASIRIDRRPFHLGLYAVAADAARAYDEAAVMAWGDHARLNFPSESQASIHEPRRSNGGHR